MMKAVIYARVSSTGERQSTERQVADLKRYAAASGMEVVEVFEEKASGAKRDREQLAACLEFLRGGGAQHLLVTELSRLGRNLRQVLEVVDDLTERGVNIYFQDHGMNTLTTKGTTNQVTKLLISMLGSFAEVEREQIASRLQSGRELAKVKGVKMGRPSGSRMTDEQLLAKYPRAVKRLKAGRTIREVAADCKLSTKTVQKIKNTLKDQYLEKIIRRGEKDIEAGNYEIFDLDKL